MFYVYILQSLNQPESLYVGINTDLRARLQKHNRCEVPRTSKFALWRIKTYVAFSDRERAYEFERYLKSGSGRTFAKKHL